MRIPRTPRRARRHAAIHTRGGSTNAAREPKGHATPARPSRAALGRDRTTTGRFVRYSEEGKGITHKVKELHRRRNRNRRARASRKVNRA